MILNGGVSRAWWWVYKKEDVNCDYEGSVNLDYVLTKIFKYYKLVVFTG